MATKHCKTCNIEKDFSEYSKSNKHIDGCLHECKKCCNYKTQKIRDKRRVEYKKEYEIIKMSRHNTCTKCKETKLTHEFPFSNSKKLCSSRCRVCTRLDCREYVKNNHELVKKKKREASKRMYAEGSITREQRDRRVNYTRKWRDKSREHIKDYNLKYKKENKALCSMLANKRRLKKLKATIEWADQSVIFDIYDESAKLTGSGDVKYNVDHIIPLSHPDVCGLHIAHNLQILTQRDNCIKSNKFDGTNDNNSWRSNE